MTGDRGHAAPARVDVWVADAGALREAAYRGLTADERARADRYLSEPARDLFAASRVLQRILGARYLERDPDNVRIERRCALCAHPEHGRPYLADGGDVDFSVSHSGTLVVLAYASGHRVGVDVESADRRVDAEQLADHVLSEAERATAPGGRDFLRLWTRKEATVKLTGHGLTVPMPTLTVLGDHTVVTPVPDGWPAAPIWLSDLDLAASDTALDANGPAHAAANTDADADPKTGADAGYVGALACTAQTVTVSVRRAEPLLAR